jgi:hypothetical protein
MTPCVETTHSDGWRRCCGSQRANSQQWPSVEARRGPESMPCAARRERGVPAGTGRATAPHLELCLEQHGARLLHDVQPLLHQLHALRGRVIVLLARRLFIIVPACRNPVERPSAPPPFALPLEECPTLTTIGSHARLPTRDRMSYSACQTGPTATRASVTCPCRQRTEGGPMP